MIGFLFKAGYSPILASIPSPSLMRRLLFAAILSVLPLTAFASFNTTVTNVTFSPDQDTAIVTLSQSLDHVFLRYDLFVGAQQIASAGINTSGQILTMGGFANNFQQAGGVGTTFSLHFQACDNGDFTYLTINSVCGPMYVQNVIYNPGSAVGITVFSDVDPNAFYAPAVAYVKAQGIVQGYSDGTFRPDQTINRAEFTKIIVQAFIGNSTNNSVCNTYPNTPYRDEQPGAWYVPFVCDATHDFIINGYPDGTFRPASTINFAEASKILVNASGLPVTQTGTWYEGYVRALAAKNAIPMSILSFDNDITRGEMAEIIWILKTGTTNQPSHTYDDLQKNVLVTATSPYISTQYGYSIQYPQNWTVSNSGSQVIFTAPEGTQATVSVSVDSTCPAAPDYYTYNGGTVIHGRTFAVYGEADGAAGSIGENTSYTSAIDATHCLSMSMMYFHTTGEAYDEPVRTRIQSFITGEEAIITAIANSLVVQGSAQTTYNDPNGVYSITYPSGWESDFRNSNGAFVLTAPVKGMTYVTQAYLQIQLATTCPAIQANTGTVQTVTLGGHAFTASEALDAAAGTGFDTITFTSQVHPAWCIVLAKIIGTANADPRTQGDYTPADTTARDKEISAMQATLKNVIETIVIH